MNNADRIRAMSDEELACLIGDSIICSSAVEKQRLCIVNMGIDIHLTSTIHQNEAR